MDHANEECAEHCTRFGDGGEKCCTAHSSLREICHTFAILSSTTSLPYETHAWRARRTRDALCSCTPAFSTQQFLENQKIPCSIVDERRTRQTTGPLRGGMFDRCRVKTAAPWGEALASLLHRLGADDISARDGWQSSSFWLFGARGRPRWRVVRAGLRGAGTNAVVLGCLRPDGFEPTGHVARSKAMRNCLQVEAFRDRGLLRIERCV